jgi:ectoine hydroxylase-related dioxygenase (phytanoyl-CoA dioxygenase family)
VSFDAAAFDREGFAMIPALLSPDEVGTLLEIVERNTRSERGRGGVRDVLDNAPALRDIAAHSAVCSIVESILGRDAFLVRSTLFDKTVASNWKVPWHQDITIAVREQRNTDGFGPWSMKAGILHVQPPTEVLSQMVTVRIHLDACPTTNGPLRVLPGSHHLGRLNQNHVDQYVDETAAFTCEAGSGEALIMRPLLLHSSSPSQTPSHRRVLHFDYATGQLPNGLEWHMIADRQRPTIVPVESAS